MSKNLCCAAILLAVFLPALPGLPALPALSAFAVSVSAAQIPFAQAMTELTSPDAGVRFRAAQMLKEAAYPEAAIPLAALLADKQDAVQLEAIAAELNIFLADKIVPRKRVAMVVEVRNAVLAEAAFSKGPLAIGTRAVPMEVLNGLLGAVRDNNPRVGLEALYAFGTLAIEPGGAERRQLLRASGPSLASFIGSPDPAMRYAGVRVLGRVFAKRPQDEAIDPGVGDAVITALNDKDRAVKTTAMEALGAMRYDRGVQALTELFQYFGKGAEAEAALDALAHIADRSSATVLSGQLASKSSALKGIAIEGLARLGDAGKLADIQAALNGERADNVLLAGSFASVVLSNGSIDPIGEALTQPKLRAQAKAYIVELAPGRLSMFTRHLQDPDARVRADVVDALGLAGDPAALPLIEPMQTDRDPDVARAAEHAVARLRKH
jgi:HEAT repeat protein